MKICPNCGEKLSDNFRYCDVCGSKLDGSKVGNFKTDIDNVFFNGKYYYLYVKNERQAIVIADTLGELKFRLKILKLPWENLKGNDISVPVEINPRPKISDYAIAGVSELERNPAFDNLEEMFK